MKTELSVDGVTVDVDHSRCSGTGYCADGLPALFVVEDNRAWLREDFDPASADRDEIEDAAASCPWFAITVGEAAGGDARAH